MGLIRKASDVIGANVENINGENLGEIEDLAVDARTGQIRYAVLSFGGFMGIGDKLFAVPWTAFTKQDESTYVLHVDKDRLENAPGFAKNNWPNMANEQWGEQVHAFYNVRPYWQTTGRTRFQDDQYNRGRHSEDDYGRTQRDRYARDDRYGRGGQFDPGRFTNLDRTCVRVLEQNDFELTDAIDKAESETNGQAISARCQLGSATQTGSRNFTDEDQYERGQRGSSRVLIEVATFTPGDTQNLRIVTISPETGEVIRTRPQTLSSSGTRSDASDHRNKMAEGK